MYEISKDIEFLTHKATLKSSYLFGCGFLILYNRMKINEKFKNLIPFIAYISEKMFVADSLTGNKHISATC